MADQPSDQFFRDMCHHAGIALIATDAEFRIRFWNAAAGRVFGGSAETMLGQQITSVVPFERRELAVRLLERSLFKGEVSEFEFPHRSPTGDPIYLAVTISPIIEAGGERVGASVSVRNVTRRMELEREIGEANKMAALGSMAGEVAHHFNNVIGGIITSIDFVQNSDDVMMLRRVLKSTSASLARANQLIRSLLAFAEGDRSDSPSRDAAQTVLQFVERLGPPLEARGIRLETDLQPVPSLLPAKRVLTILERLTENACEAMPQGGVLRIEVAPGPDNRIVIRVLDTGGGIAEEDLPHVFEPFFTTKAGSTGTGTHAGLGLAVVHGIVRELGGTVTIGPRPEGGTVSTVTLPANPEMPGAPKP